jgi:hypothetical protein
MHILQHVDKRQRGACRFMNIESGLRFVDSLAFGQTKALAYQLLLSLLASFGGGPNVNSRDAATKGG